MQWRRDRQLRDRARENRQWPTDAEKILWLHLRKHKAEGWHWRRQHPLEIYVRVRSRLSGRWSEWSEVARRFVNP
ncbi:MAG: DUF559 domain-containing protein [Chlorobia bacterium]|nr:DUF559 domain-containing protein [Fimbriimonadaceae bacterium]